MKIDKKDVLNVLCFLFALIIFATFLIGVHLTIEYCKNESRNTSQPPYKARYGDFWSSDYVYFYSYKVDGDRYLFYDKNGNFIKEFVAKDGNSLSVEKR